MAAQNLLEDSQQWAALLVALFAEAADTQVNFLAAAARQADHDAIQQRRLRFGFHLVCPDHIRTVVAAKDLRVRTRPFKPFPPQIPPPLHPELLIPDTLPPHTTY